MPSPSDLPDGATLSSSVKEAVILFENSPTISTTSTPPDSNSTSDKAFSLNYEEMKKFARENANDFSTKSLPGIAPPRTTLEKFGNAGKAWRLPHRTRTSGYIGVTFLVERHA
jgi:hypothetical protein